MPHLTHHLNTVFAGFGAGFFAFFFVTLPPPLGPALSHIVQRERKCDNWSSHTFAEVTSVCNVVAGVSGVR